MMQIANDLEIKEALLPDGVRVVVEKRPGAFHPDGTIAKAGETQEIAYALRADAVGWQSLFFLPRPVCLTWHQWTQADVDRHIKTLVKEYAAKHQQAARRHAEQINTYTLARIKISAQQAAFRQYFAQHARTISKVRAGSRILDKYRCELWLLSKDDRGATVIPSYGTKRESIERGQAYRISRHSAVIPLSEAREIALSTEMKVAGSIAVRRAAHEGVTHG